MSCPCANHTSINKNVSKLFRQILVLNTINEKTKKPKLKLLNIGEVTQTLQSLDTFFFFKKSHAVRTQPGVVNR